MRTSTETIRQGLLIGGAWRPTDEWAVSTATWSGDVVGQVAVATAADVVDAVDAAETALAFGWPVAERTAVLSRAALLLTERIDKVSELLSAEVGKPITAARGEVLRAVQTLTWSAEEAKRLPGERVPLDAVPAGDGTFAFTIPVPKGVVAAITPFNFPLNLLLHKVGPALAAGCPVVVKPSDHAPLVAGAAMQLLLDAGVPIGWVSLLTGPPQEIVGALQADERVAVVTFTGSAPVGWALKAAAPRKEHVLELGSNTAMVVAADADLDRAVRAAVEAAFTYAGQACVSLQRVYVHRDVADTFATALAEAAAALPVGNPADPATVVGPVITAQAADRLTGWLRDAEAAGAEILTGGRMSGRVLPATVLRAVPEDSPLVCEEVFGPVVSVIEVDDIEDGIRRVNASAYGLNTSLYTSDLATAMRYAATAQAGSVLINMPPSFRADHMPYGGVKDSGQGREGVRYAIADMVREKLVVLHP